MYKYPHWETFMYSIYILSSVILNQLPKPISIDTEIPSHHFPPSIPHAIDEIAPC